MKKFHLVSTFALIAAVPSLACAQDASTAKPKATDSDTIVVTATRSGDAIPTDLIGSSVTVLDNADITYRQTRILSDVLRDVPGVAINRTGAVGGLTNIYIRGSESGQVLVFVDGIKADDPYYGAFDFGTLINDEASRVEVLRGQQSSLYGSDAIGGVVSYTTLSGRELPGISLRAEGGSYGTYDGGARIAGVKGDFDYALSASYYHTDGYPIAPGGARNMGSNSLGVSGKVNWALTPHFKLTAVSRYSLTDADTDGFGMSANPPLVAGTPVNSAVDEPGGFYHNLGWYGLVGAQWDLFNGVMTNAANVTIADTVRHGYDFGAMDYGDHGRRWRASFNSTVRFGSEHVKNRFTIGVDAEWQQFRNTTPGGFADNSLHRLNSQGVVMQYDLTVDERLALSASGRIDANSYFNGDSTFRLTGSYLFPEGTRIHAAYGTGVRNPTLTELFNYSTGMYIGNPDLRPERSKGWEAGIEQRLAGDHVTLGVTWFDSRYVDRIDYESGYIGGVYEYSIPYNVAGSSKQQGVEASVSAKLRNWRLDLAYGWLDAPQTISALTAEGPANVTIQAAHRPGNIASGNLTWAPRALPVSATLTVRYNGRMNDYAYDAAYDRLVAPLKAYTLVNLGGTYDVNPHVRIFARIENLFDEKYQEAFGYAAMGRAAYGGVRVKL